MTMSLKVTFIDDPSADKQIAVINTTGSFLKANPTISDVPIDNYPIPLVQHYVILHNMMLHLTFKITALVSLT